MTQFRIDASVRGIPGPRKRPDRERKEDGEGFKTAAAAGALGILGLSVLGSDPGLQVWVTPHQAPVGEPVTFVYHVSYRNPERPVVRRPEVEDELCPQVEFLEGDGDEDGLLGPDETWRFRCTLTAEELQARCAESPSGAISHKVTAGAEDLDGRDLRPRRVEHSLVCEPHTVPPTPPALALRTRPPPPTAHGLTAIFEHEVRFVSGDDLWAEEVRVEDSVCGAGVEGPAVERGDDDRRLEPGEIWRYTCRTPVPAVHRTSAAEPLRTRARATGRRSDGEPLEATAEPAAARIEHTAGRLWIEALEPDGGQVPFRVTYEPGADGSPATGLIARGPLCAPELLDRPDRGGDGDSLLERDEAWIYTCQLAAVEAGADPGATRVPLTVSGTDLDRDPLEPATASRLIVPVARRPPPGGQLEIVCRESPCSAFGRPPAFEYEVRYRPVRPGTAARNVELQAEHCLPDPLARPDRRRAADGDALLEEGESWFYTCEYWRRQGTDPPRVEASVRGSDQDGPLGVATAGCEARSVERRPPRRRGRGGWETLHFEDSPERPVRGPRHGLFDRRGPLEFFGDGGSGPVLVRGHSARFRPTDNAAVVLDTFRRDVEEDLWTCLDRERPQTAPDPYLPCEDRDYDDLPLGNVLIVNRNLDDKDRDGYVDKPDDEGATEVRLVLDFGPVGLATVYSVTLLDVEKNSRVEFEIEGRKWPREVPLPRRNNHVWKVCFGAEGIRNVETMTIVFPESGAIDNVVFEPGRADGPRRRTGRRSRR